MCVLLYDGSTRRLTQSRFMEKPGIQHATPGVQDIGLSSTPRRLQMKVGSFERSYLDLKVADFTFYF